MEKSIEMETSTGTLILSADEFHQCASVSFTPKDEKVLEENHFCDIDVAYITFRNKNDEHNDDCEKLTNMHIYAYGKPIGNSDNCVHTVIETAASDSIVDKMTKEELKNLKQDIKAVMDKNIAIEYIGKILESTDGKHPYTLMDDICEYLSITARWDENHRYSEADIRAAFNNALLHRLNVKL